ncbi:hypothetical protein EDC94DRAFT_662189 [Helicostylum pulchrum]|nr:hypothetical protein EDC94DRAFT_662189 [Helicostylum pulchrum]
MTDQYNNYRRAFRNFEVAYTILKAIDIVERYRQNNRLSIDRLNQGLQRLEGGLQQATYVDVNRSLAIGAKLMTDLKLTWNMYVVFSTSFYDLQRAYQGSINAMKRNVLATVIDFQAGYNRLIIFQRFIARLRR